MIAAIYARVSTADQHCELQLTELHAFATRNGWSMVDYVEHASGKNERRPVLKKLMEDARLKRFDIVLVWKVDRLGRSVGHFTQTIKELDAMGVRFIAPNQGIDTDQKNPIARFLLNMLAVLAEFERDLIVERSTAGLAEYRKAFSEGKVGIDRERRSKSKRDLPHGRPEKIWDREKVKELRAAGKSWSEIAEALGVSRSAARRAAAA